MEITSEIIKKYFKFEITWDVTKYCPEGSVDEYRFRCENFMCRLMYYKARDWEDPHWKLEARNLEYPFREVNVDWLKDVEDIVACLGVFDTINDEAKELAGKLLNEIEREKAKP